MVERDGWQRPVRYTSAEEEFEQLRKTVGLGDISPVGKLNLQGDKLDSFLSRVFGDVTSPDVGAVSRHILGGDVESQPVVLARLAHDEVVILTGPGQAPVVSEALQGQADGCVHAVDITSALAGVRVAGPSAHLLLSGVTELDASPDAFLDMSCAQAKLAEIHGLLLRIDLGRLPSYELYFGREFGEYMWDALLETGEEYQVTPFGIEAMSRLEGDTH